MAEGSTSTIGESANDAAVLELVNEFLDRAQRGEQPTMEEYCERHPQLADGIREIFPALLTLEDLKPRSGDGIGEEAENLPDQIGDYRIIGRIGRGGMGIVYEAEQESLGRRVALKVLPRNLLDSTSAQIRFQREARAAAKMHHTNIVPVFEVGHDGDFFFYAMQLIAGHGLDQIIDELRESREDGGIGQLSLRDASEVSLSAVTVADAPSESASTASSTGGGSGPTRTRYFHSVANLGMQVADALAFAHSRNVVHRDIKPSNLLLDVHGVTWVADFGLAKLLEDDQTLTRSGDYLGTLRYMSPERFRGQCDARSDIYALGLTLYELLLLRPAFSVSDRVKLIYLINNTEPPQLRSIAPEIPRDLETIVQKCFEKEPTQRYQTAVALREDLQRFLNDEPILARRLSGVERTVRWMRRNKGLAAALAAIATLLIVLGIAGFATAVYQSQLREDAEAARHTAEGAHRDAETARSSAERALHAAETARDDATAAQRVAEREQLKAENAEEAARLALTRAEEASVKERDARRVAEAAKSALSRNLYLSETRRALLTRDEPGGRERIRQVVRRWANDAEAKANRGWEWHLLKAASRRDGVTLPFRAPKAAKWSDDGRFIAVASGKEIHIIDGSTGKTLGEPLRGHTSDVGHLAWRHGGKLLASVSEDWTIRIWDVAERKESRAAFGPMKQRPAMIAWSPEGDRIAFTVDRIGVYIVDLKKQHAEPELIPNSSRMCRFLEWSPDGTHLAEGLWFDNRMTIYDVEKKSVARQLSRATRVLWKNGHEVDKILHTKAAGQIDLYDATGNSRDQIYLGHREWASVLHLSADGRTFLSGAGDEKVHVWDRDSGRIKRTFVEHTSAIQGGSLSPDGKRAVSFDRFTARLWNVNEPIHFVIDNRHGTKLNAGVRQFRVSDLAWDRSGTRLATASYDRNARIWDTSTGTIIRQVPALSKTVAFHPDDKHLAIGSVNVGGLVIESDGKDQPKKFSNAATVDWNRTGRLVAGIQFLGKTHQMQIFEFPSMKVLHEVTANPEAVAFSPVTDAVAYVVNPHKLVVMRDKQVTHEFAGHRQTINDIAWSPDGKRLATVGRDRDVRIWSLDGGEPRVMRGHRGIIVKVAWHPDGNRIASASLDGTVRIWDPDTQTEVLTLTGEGTSATAIAWSADGNRLAIGNEGGEIVIWNAARQ